MGFTKLDEGILQSSVMAEDSDTFKVWIAFLASCGPDGIARVSPVFIASACHLSQDVVDRSIETLSAPDKYSRSLADEGRRMKRVDGGFFLINYDRYREFAYSMTPEAIRQREHRARAKTKVCDIPVTVRDCHAHSASVLTSGVLLTLKEDIIYTWHEFARRHGLTEIKDIPKGSKRERTLNARLEDKGFDFKALLAKVEESPFLLGKKTDFKATFDWILAPSNYQKIIEGNYRGATPFDGPREWLKRQEEKEDGND